ncbi:MAG TPA: NTP transferase domain-containing protein [Myxococcota bacterium]|nr:NTP transferase domain-containing protein [Myxococcota bacterium]
MSIPAIVAAGDLRAAKAIHGESKAYLEIGGVALVARTVATLQAVPEVGEVWVVGNADRLRGVLGHEAFRSGLRKPLHVVPQFRNLYENGWETFRRLLPGAGPDGRDPQPSDTDTAVLYLPVDIPFATPEEISAFVRQSLEAGCDYALGLVTEESMRGFYPSAPGAPGIRMAYFNLREGRFRQSNLHLIRPARIRNRHYIDEMYEHRHQREFGPILALAWRLLRSERGGFGVLGYFLLMHLAGLTDRWGLTFAADALRRLIPTARIERGVSALLGGSFRLIVTEAGGCAADVDTETDFDSAKLCFDVWQKAQRERAARLYGALPSPPATREPPP